MINKHHNNSSPRHPLDQFIENFDRSLRVITGQAKASRPTPAGPFPEIALPEAQRTHSAGLMRVNHVGEVCAQALYDAQSVFSKTTAVKLQFAHAALEEEDHLAWTAERLRQLNSQPSLLNPLWYAGAYTCGLIAGRLGDGASLGFVVETEKQVEAHLMSHLEKLPEQDKKSRAIVDQMRIDEIAHGAAANALGAVSLPAPIKLIMQGMAKFMTSTAYYI